MEYSRGIGANNNPAWSNYFDLYPDHHQENSQPSVTDHSPNDYKNDYQSEQLQMNGFHDFDNIAYHAVLAQNDKLVLRPSISDALAGIKNAAEGILKKLGEKFEVAEESKEEVKKETNYTGWTSYFSSLNVNIFNIQTNNFWSSHQVNHSSHRNSSKPVEKKKNTEKADDHLKQYQVIYQIASTALIFVFAGLIGSEYAKYSEVTQGLKAIKDLRKETTNKGNLQQYDAMNETFIILPLTDIAKDAERVFKSVRDKSIWGLARRVTLLSCAVIGGLGTLFLSSQAVSLASLGIVATVAVMIFVKEKNQISDQKDVSDLRKARKNIDQIQRAKIIMNGEIEKNGQYMFEYPAN